MALSPHARPGTLGTRGAVFVEHLLIFLPLFILFLGAVQLALIQAADIQVAHAANTAARAAIVVLDDDPMYYGGAPRMRVTGSAGGFSIGGAIRGAIGGALGGGDTEAELLRRLGLGSAGLSRLGGGLGGGLGSLPGMPNARYAAIRDAASIPLLSMSPNMQELVDDPSVYAAIGGTQADRALTGAAFYNKFAVAVTFPGSPGSMGFVSDFSGSDEITVRVTYLYRCSLPLVSRIVCRDFGSLAGSGLGALAADRALRGLGGGRNTGPIGSRLMREMGSEGAGLAELIFADAPWLGFATLSSGARFRVLREEATLPLQTADYVYPSEGG